jgi:hypothetical protein
VRAPERLRGRGLAAPGWSDEADDAAVVERDRGGVQHQRLAAELADPAERDLGGEALAELGGGAQRERLGVSSLALRGPGRDARADGQVGRVGALDEQVGPFRLDRLAVLELDGVVELDPHR